MKNKKRVVIILLILIVIVLLILGTVLVCGGMKAKEISNFETEVAEAACEYASDENFTEAICNAYENLCKVRYSTLITREYLSPDLTNPKTKTQISEDTSSYVQISFEDDKIVCTYKEG